MYKLVHTHIKSEIAHALSYATHFLCFSTILSMFQTPERDIIIYVIPKKNKTRPKIKYFCLFENFQCFWIFFFFFE